jgi:predicted transcriptional regulator
MNSLKDDVIDMIRRLPEDCTLEDIQYHLYVRAKIENGLRDVEEGRVMSHEQAKERIKDCLKSSGQRTR